MGNNFNKDRKTGKKVGWKDIKILRVSKEIPNTF